MQRPNKKTKDRETNEILEFIYQNSFGNPIILDAAPASDQMKANTWGVYGLDIYIKFANNVLLKFSGTLVA